MRRRHVLTYVLLLGLTARASAQEVSRHQKSLVLSSATVIDGTGAAPRRDVTVIVQGDRIAAMGPSGAQPVPKGAEVVDARGLFLIPGLWDMHVHMAAESFLDLFVAAGVTTVRDIGAPPGMDLRSLSSRVEKGERLGPRMILSSPIIDGDPPLLPGVLVARSPADAVRIVDEQRHTGADFLKIYNMLSRETFFALAERARAVGIPFAGHVPLGVSAAEASDAKMASIEHLTGVLLGCSRREDALRRELLARVTAKGAAPYLVPRLLFWSDRGGFKWPVSALTLKPNHRSGCLHLRTVVHCTPYRWQCAPAGFH